MNISAFATCLNVKDLYASSEFMKEHFGFEEELTAEGFISLIHPKTGQRLIYHEIGLDILPDYIKYEHEKGIILTFIVSNIEEVASMLKDKGIFFTTPLRTEAWGEKLFLIKDPNGVVIEIAEWDRQTDTQTAKDSNCLNILKDD